MKYFIVLFTFYSLSVNACLIDGPQRIIKTSNATSSDLKNLITFKKCKSDQVDHALSFINDLSGKITPRVLKTEFSEIKLNKSITITKLDEILNQNTALPKDWRLVEARLAHGQKRAFSVSGEESLSFECLHCENTGKKNLKAIITNSITNNIRAVWFNATLAVKSKSLIATRNLSLNNQSLNPSDFKIITTYSENPSQLFTKRDQLLFYKLNKGKSKGEAITFNDITPINLVSVGRPVTILLNTKGLTLEGKATPHQSGKLGQVIRLKNNRTNKTIIGKVVDFNKVEVQL